MLDQYLSEQEHCLTENFVLLRKSIVPAKYDKPVFSLGEKNLLIFFLGGGFFFFSLKAFSENDSLKQIMSQDHQALSMYVYLWVINNLSLDLGITDIIKSGIWVFYMYFAVISLNAIQSLPFRLFLKEGIYIFYWNKYSYADKTLLSYKHHNEDKSWSLSKILPHKQEPYTFFFFPGGSM